MAVRLGEYLEWGVLYHSHRNSTHGHIKLRGLEQTIHFGLTGDPGPELCGKALRFEPRPVKGRVPSELPRHLRALHPNQVGPTGLMTINRAVRVFPGCGPEALSGRPDAAGPDGLPPPVWKRGLTLEWYSQNGRVLIELTDPLLWIADYGDALDEDDDSVWSVPPEPKVWESSGLSGRFEGLCDEAQEKSDWYPGSDRRDDSELTTEEFVRELELMDEFMNGEHKGDSLRSVIMESVPSGPMEELSDEEAEGALKVALAQLALRSVAIYLCKHYTARDALRYLRTVVASEGEYLPALARGSFVQNFMTSDDCRQCEAEFEKEFEQQDAEIRRMMEQDEQGDAEPE